MDKTFLETRIEERAEERFEKELIDFASFIMHHPLAGKLRVKIGDENIPIANLGQNYGLVNTKGLKNKNSEFTNLAEVKDELVEKYKKEETDMILNKLTTIEYLYND